MKLLKGWTKKEKNGLIMGACFLLAIPFWCTIMTMMLFIIPDSASALTNDTLISILADYAITAAIITILVLNKFYEVLKYER